MKRWAMCVGLALMAGCGSGDGDRIGTGGTGGSVEHADPIIGNWVIEQSVTVAVGLVFSGDKTYALTILRVDSDGNHAQVEKGSYAELPGTVTFTPLQSSCSGAHPPYRETYTVDATSLVLTDTSGALQFSPNPYPPSGVLIYGCFASDGTFTASPLAPVSN